MVKQNYPLSIIKKPRHVEMQAHSADGQIMAISGEDSRMFTDGDKDTNPNYKMLAETTEEMLRDQLKHNNYKSLQMNYGRSNTTTEHIDDAM